MVVLLKNHSASALPSSPEISIGIITTSYEFQTEMTMVSHLALNRGPLKISRAKFVSRHSQNTSSLFVCLRIDCIESIDLVFLFLNEIFFLP